jgi:hypothetical protein
MFRFGTYAMCKKCTLLICVRSLTGKFVSLAEVEKDSGDRQLRA